MECAVEILNKEIDESIRNIENQHKQIKYYFQSYMVAVVGIFTLGGYFSKGGIQLDESIIGVSYTFCVFFLGWIFLSIVSHKVSMLILTFKHMAVIRKERLALIGDEALNKNYVMPTKFEHIRMPGLLKFLPYLLFVFNFLILFGTTSYYLSFHFDYHQVIALITCISVFLGSYYPVVCVSFNKHTACAARAKSLEAFNRLEKKWNTTNKAVNRKYRLVKRWFVFSGLLVSFSVAMLSFIELSKFWRDTLSVASIMGLTLFGYLRYYAEMFKIDFVVKKLNVT